MNTVIYSISLEEHPNIIPSLKAYLTAQDFTVREFNKGSGIILQARRGGTFKKIIGLSLGLNIIIDRNHNSFTVSFTEASWIDKIIVAVVGAILIWPLIITVGVGIYNQATLPQKITEFLNGEVHNCIER